MSLTASELGVDDRAAELLTELAEDKQQAILEKCKKGLDEGKIRNASAYVASACKKPDALGIDERASELLNRLPKTRREDVLQKLKNSEGITNPSAWVAKACLKEKQHERNKAYKEQYDNMSQYDKVASFLEPYFGKGFFDGKGGSRDEKRSVWKDNTKNLDASATKLLESVDPEVKQDILKKLRNEPQVRNPSAWVAKAAMKAGAVANHSQRPGDDEEIYVDLDTEAMELLDQLDEDVKANILDKLRNDAAAGLVRNPSAWVVKAALKAGASPAQSTQPVSNRKYGALDAKATSLLHQLDDEEQEKIMTQLEEMKERGQVRNPSGWVVRAALNAGAKADASEGVGHFPKGTSKGGKGGSKDVGRPGGYDGGKGKGYGKGYDSFKGGYDGGWDGGKGWGGGKGGGWGDRYSPW